MRSNGCQALLRKINDLSNASRPRDLAYGRYYMDLHRDAVKASDVRHEYLASIEVNQEATGIAFYAAQNRYDCFDDELDVAMSLDDDGADDAGTVEISTASV
jgi:hypothetical protein